MIQNPDYNHPHNVVGVVDIAMYDADSRNPQEPLAERTFISYTTREEILGLARDLPENTSVHTDVRVMLTASPLHYGRRHLIFPVVDCPEVTQ